MGLVTAMGISVFVRVSPCDLLRCPAILTLLFIPFLSKLHLILVSLASVLMGSCSLDLRQAQVWVSPAMRSLRALGDAGHAGS
jgi:hypothetical protein